MQYRTIDEGSRHRRELWLDDDTNAAHLWVLDLPMRIGTSEVRMAGIGDVYTERAHRMKGYMRYLYADTVRYMTDEGYDVSMLFGIPNFYTKFGYATSLPETTFTIQTRDAEAAATTGYAGTPRPIEPGDFPRVLELHNRENAERTGSLIRTAEGFTEFHGTDWGVRAVPMVWEDTAGTLLAYAVWDGGPGDWGRHTTEVKVGELGARDASMFPVLLRAVAEQAVEKRCSEITFHLPPDHAFAEYAQRFGIRWTVTYPRHSHGMMRILNQQPLFEKILSVLSDRLAKRADARAPEALSIETDLGVTTLGFGEGKVRLDGTRAPVRLSLSQDVLMQLIMGYRSARDVLTASGVDLVGMEEAELLPLLEILFPKSVPYMWVSDYF
jgi:predicted acetyltransferase